MSGWRRGEGCRITASLTLQLGGAALRLKLGRRVPHSFLVLE